MTGSMERNLALAITAESTMDCAMSGDVSTQGGNSIWTVWIEASSAEVGWEVGSNVGMAVGSSVSVEAGVVVGSSVGTAVGLGVGVGTCAGVAVAVGCATVVTVGADGVAMLAVGVSVGVGEVEQATETTPNVRSITRMNFTVSFPLPL